MTDANILGLEEIYVQDRNGNLIKTKIIAQVDTTKLEQEINNKLNNYVPITQSSYKIYGVDANGEQTTINWAFNSTTRGDIVVRDDGGNIIIDRTPEQITFDIYAVNKKYVDTKISTINTELTSKISAINTELTSKISAINTELTSKIAEQNNIKNGTGYGSLISASVNDDDAPYTEDLLPIASGHEAFAWGKGAIAAGKRSFSFGNQNKSEGNCSFVIGQKNYADGSATFTGGLECENYGNYGITFGKQLETQKNLLAFNFGISNIIYSDDTTTNYDTRFAIGTGLSVGNVKFKSALGQYNVNYSDAIFEYGCGTSSSDRKNAFDIATTGAIRQYYNNHFINKTSAGSGTVRLMTDSIPTGADVYLQFPTESGKLAIEKNTVAKINTPMTFYATNNKGEFESTLKYSYDPIQYTIPRRYTNGNIIVPITPGANDHAASKSYVDTQYNNLLNKYNELYIFLENQGKEISTLQDSDNLISGQIAGLAADIAQIKSIMGLS